MVMLSVFVLVLTIVSLVKVIQIAEDVRAWRAGSDSTVKPPMGTGVVVLLCVVVSILVTLVILGVLSAFGGSVLSALQSIVKV